ncbi:hypothetical protein WJX74_001539 [Apatococcus lobatus]|uniref:Uncharacterized protein n=1 Tax=Apatococcus lobatus TaxID=904363 RepID=A0AAW1QD26_9CHLO
MGQLCSTPGREDGREQMAEAYVPGASTSAVGSRKTSALSKKSASPRRQSLSESFHAGGNLSSFILKNRSRTQTTSVEESAASLQRTPTGMSQQRMPSTPGRKENLQLDNDRLRSKIMALERLADQSERAQTRLEQRCEKLAQDNADAEAEIQRLQIMTKDQSPAGLPSPVELQADCQLEPSYPDPGPETKDKTTYVAQLEKMLAGQRKQGEDLQQQLDMLRQEKEQLDSKKKRLESQYETVAGRLASVTTGEANPVHQDEPEATPQISDRQQRIAAINAKVLSAIKAANPQSPIRDWWTGHDYSVWEGIKCRDGIIVGMALPDACLQSLPEEIGQLAGLETLIADHNELQKLPGEMGQLYALRCCWLHANQLQVLPPEVCKCAQLRQLLLGQNGLSILPEDLGELQQLTHLWLEDNQLQRLPPSLASVQGLKRMGADSRIPKIRRKSKVTFGADDTSNHFNLLGLQSGHSSASTTSDMAPLSLHDSAAGYQQPGSPTSKQPCAGEPQRNDTSNTRLRHSDGSASLANPRAAWHSSADSVQSADGDGNWLGPLPSPQPPFHSRQTPHDLRPFPRSSLGRAASAPPEDLQFAHLHVGKSAVGPASSNAATPYNCAMDGLAAQTSRGDWSGTGSSRSPSARLPLQFSQESPSKGSYSADDHTGLGEPCGRRASSSRASLNSNGDASVDEQMARMFRSFTRQAASSLEAKSRSDRGSKRVSALPDMPRADREYGYPHRGTRCAVLQKHAPLTGSRKVLTVEHFREWQERSSAVPSMVSITRPVAPHGPSKQPQSAKTSKEHRQEMEATTMPTLPLDTWRVVMKHLPQRDRAHQVATCLQGLCRLQR